MKYSKNLPWLTALFTFMIYMVTVAPSVIQIDSGELTAVQIAAGIAHPTGYPLFTIMGYLWSLIPLPFTKVFQMNILASLYCSAAAGIFVRMLLFASGNLQAFKKLKEYKTKKKKNKSVKETVVDYPAIYTLIAAAGAGLILAFSKTFWFQSTSVEVYSLHLVLIILICYLLLKAFVLGGEKISDQHWLVFSIVLALGFSNHMTTLLILPGTAYLYFIKYKFSRESFLRLGLMVTLFTAVLILLYSYLPVRSAQNPSLNWGYPVDLERIFRHISGKQYQVWLFSSTDSAKKQLGYFISNLPVEFALSLIPAAAGMIISAFRAKRLFIFLAVTFLSTVLYSINYDIADIDSYFLLGYITLAVFSFFALLRVFEYFHSKKGFNAGIAAAAIIILLQLYINFKEVNQSGNYIFEDYTKEILSGVPKNSLIMSYLWDYFISPSYYYQYAENYRKDVAVIDKELLRRSWYFHQVETNHPGLMNGIKNEVDLFKKALVPFERDEAYNSNLLENLYRRIMTGLVTTNLNSKTVYISPELFENEMQRGEFVLPPEYTLVPDLFLFKVVKGKEYVPAADPHFRIRFSGVENHYTSLIKKMIGTMLTRRALYEMQFDKRDRAKIYIDKIKKDLPDYDIPAKLLQVYN